MMLRYNLKAIRLAIKKLVMFCVQSEIEDRDAKASLPRKTDLETFVLNACKKHDAELIATVSYWLGQLATAWKHDPFLVLHHMGITEEKNVSECVYLMVMSIWGTGIRLQDDYSEEFDKACEILNMEDKRIDAESYPLLECVSGDLIYKD